MAKSTKDPGEILAVPNERYLLTLRTIGHFFKRCSPNKIVVEFDERSVAKVVGSQIIVSDILGVKATAQRSHGFITFRALTMASRTSSPYSQGPNNSHPG